MASHIQEPASPCIHHCGFRDGCCRNCFRTVDEVKAWRTLSAAEKQQVMELATARKAKTVMPPR